GSAIVRLAGIAAPARGTICHGDRLLEFDCGSASANALAALVRSRDVDCTVSGHDRQGRPVGDCMAGGRKLSQTLVQQGWARATVSDLHATEADARSAQRGIWRSTDKS
ncbi:MAG TPA: thermonuclease family protein, partial [Rhodopila sp.]|nr:thermonuclease family protein [Rhodopila sp.]